MAHATLSFSLYHACADAAVVQDMAAANLDQNVQGMASRASAAVSAVVAGSVTALNLRDKYSMHMHGAGARAAELVRQRFDDAVELTDANAKQLRAVVALSAHMASRGHCAIGVADVAMLDSLGDMLAFNEAVSDSVAASLRTPAKSDVHVTCLHVLAAHDVVASLCELNGTGLERYDSSDTESARDHNAIHMVARDATGAVAEWVKSSDIHLSLLPACVSGGMFLSYELAADGEGWRITYAIGGTGSSRVFSIMIEIGFVTVRECTVKVCKLFLL